MAEIVIPPQNGVTAPDASGSGSGARVRSDILSLQAEYESGNRKPLSDLLRAWQYIQQLNHDDYFSFFTIAGYHGEPFRGAGWGNPQWWGGYCNHGNVLFPTWHRAYLFRLENALRRAPGCENVTLPYWNEAAEISEDKKDTVVPWVFLKKEIELDDGKTMLNPLHSYKFQHRVADNLSYPLIVNTSAHDDSQDQMLNPIYDKSPGYETCRYPFSGFTDSASITWNEGLKKKTEEEVNNILCENVYDWITGNGYRAQHSVAQEYHDCLSAPNYTVFSNTTSAQQWNEDHAETVVPLESPHNHIHLAVGGFDVAHDKAGNDWDAPQYQYANGDMGENNTASFDPIFFFHHCFVDKTFWDWQKTHHCEDEGKTPCTDQLEIIDAYPGTNSVDSQGPTPGVAGGTWLSLDTKLQPFKYGDIQTGDFMTSHDVININTSLGYDYAEPVSKPRTTTTTLARPSSHPTRLHAKVTGVNRAAISGSFIIATYKTDTSTGKKTLIHQESVLSRWGVEGCANCQNHLQVKVHVPLHGLTDGDLAGPEPKYAIESKVVTRKGVVQPKEIPTPRVVPVLFNPAAGK